MRLFANHKEFLLCVARQKNAYGFGVFDGLLIFCLRCKFHITND